MRKITVVSSDTQTKVTFETEASTVEDLLNEMDERNIAYEGKALFEGISHTPIDLDYPEALLPHDNQYRGTVTNDLVIMITAGKKISSGMDRKEVFAKVKEYELQDTVKEVYGTDYTHVATEKLVEMVLEYEEKMKKQSSTAENPAEDPCNSNCPAEGIFVEYMRILIKNGVVHPYSIIKALEGEGILKLAKKEPGQPTVESGFTDEEIEDMFEFLDN